MSTLESAWICRAGWATAAFATLLSSCSRPEDSGPAGVAAGATTGYPEQRVSFAGDVAGVGGITYATREGFRPLTLDLYLPPAQRNEPARPLIVYVHGGAWVTGTPRGHGPDDELPQELAALAARGYVVASIQYRLRGEARFPASIHDVKEAIRFLRRHAAHYGIDPGRVGIWGPSAGGQLAALAAVSCGVAELAPPNDEGTSVGESDCVQAGVSWFGVHDFRTVPTPPGQTGPGPYLGCPADGCPEATLRFASPVAYVDRSDPPMLLIHGAADTLVVPSQSQEFHDLLQATGVPVTLLYLPGVDHGFRGPTAEASREANEQALDATFRFFDESLAKRPR